MLCDVTVMKDDIVKVQVDEKDDDVDIDLLLVLLNFLKSFDDGNTEITRDFVLFFELFYLFKS